MSGNFWDSIDKGDGEASGADADQNLDNTFSTFPPEGQEGRDFGGFEAEQDTQDQVDPSTVVDAEAREAAPKKRSMLPVIAAIGLVVLGIFGFISYQFVQKFFPSEAAQAEQAAGSSILADSSFDAPPASPSTAQEPVASTVIPLGKPSETDVPDEQAAVALEQPQPVSPSTAAQPVETVSAAPAPVPAPVAAPVATPEPTKTVAAAAPVAPVVPVASASPSPAATVAESVAKPAATIVAPAKPAVQAPRVRPTRTVKANNAAKPVHKPASAKPRQTAKASGIKPDASRAPVFDERASDAGRLSGYSILAFEPKHGAFQQAWIRDPEGKITVVGKGDSVAGARVSEVSFADGVVKTTRGQIR